MVDLVHYNSHVLEISRQLRVLDISPLCCPQLKYPVNKGKWKIYINSYSMRWHEPFIPKWWCNHRCVASTLFHSKEKSSYPSSHSLIIQHIELVQKLQMERRWNNVVNTHLPLWSKTKIVSRAIKICTNFIKKKKINKKTEPFQHFRKKIWISNHKICNLPNLMGNKIWVYTD